MKPLLDFLPVFYQLIFNVKWMTSRKDRLWQEKICTEFSVVRDLITEALHDDQFLLGFLSNKFESHSYELGYAEHRN